LLYGAIVVLIEIVASNDVVIDHGDDAVERLDRRRSVLGCRAIGCAGRRLGSVVLRRMDRAR